MHPGLKENSREDQETKKVKKFMKSSSIVKWDYFFEEISLKNKKTKISYKPSWWLMKISSQWNIFKEYKQKV